MNFFLDAQLPPALCEIFEQAGHKVVTTAVLPNANGSSDEEIKDFSAKTDSIVVSKDKDFYYSHILNQRPRKLLLVRCGNQRLSNLIAIFRRNMKEIESAFEESDLVELFSNQVSS